MKKKRVVKKSKSKKISSVKHSKSRKLSGKKNTRTYVSYFIITSSFLLFVFVMKVAVSSFQPQTVLGTSTENQQTPSPTATPTPVYDNTYTAP